MASKMPTPSTDSPAMRRVDSSDALKTQVVLQDLTITTPVKLQRPVPTAERREKEATSPDSSTSSNSSKTASRKRTNTGISLFGSPSLLKRRSNDLTTSFVMHEGKLAVMEQGEEAKRKSHGKVTCRIARLSRETVLELAISKHAPLHLPLARMTLVHDHRAPAYGFLLIGNIDESSSEKVTTFTFTAPSKDDRATWIKELRDLTADAQTKSTPTTPLGHAATPTTPLGHAARPTTPLGHIATPTTPVGHAATARHQAREEMTEIVTTTPERPVKRGGLVYTVPPKTTHIILVRHGHYINAHAKNVSDVDQVLSQMGRQQAELTGKYLDKLYHRCPARHQQVQLYHSDLSRAVETASIISKHFASTTMTPIASSLLREGWPGQPFATDQMPAHMLPREDQDSDTKEMDRMDLERMDEAYNRFFNELADSDDECVFRVIVCHANLIRYFLCRALRVEAHGVWGHLELNHCGVARIDLCNKRPLKVLAMNETGHLPHSLTTSSEDHL